MIQSRLHQYDSSQDFSSRIEPSLEPNSRIQIRKYYFHCPLFLCCDETKRGGERERKGTYTLIIPIISLLSRLTNRGYIEERESTEIPRMKRITECSIRKILTILPVFTSIWEFFVEFRASTLSYDFTRIIQSSSRDRDRVASRMTSDDRIVTILRYDVYVSSTEIRMVKKKNGKKWEIKVY